MSKPCWLAGHVPEVFSGDANRELDVSVPEQIWSSGMVITTLLRGMLGLDPDAPMSELRWTPHLPRGWAGVTIRNLTIGRSTINLQLKQSRDGISLDIENRGPPVAFTFDPEIPAGIRNASAKLNGRALDVEVRSTATDTHARVKFDAGPRTHIEISFESGPG